MQAVRKTRCTDVLGLDDQAVTLRRGGILGSRKRWLRGTGTVLSTDLEWRCVWYLEGAANIVMYLFGFLYQVVFLLCVVGVADNPWTSQL